MQDIICEKIREPPFQVIFGLFFGGVFGTDLCFSLQGSNEGGLNWQRLEKQKKLSLITLSWSQSLANKSVFC